MNIQPINKSVDLQSNKDSLGKESRHELNFYKILLEKSKRKPANPPKPRHII